MDQPATKEPATSKNATFRLVCFTNYWMERDMSDINCTYLAYAKEVCPTTGREHMQGFAYNSSAQRSSWWNKQFNPSEWKDDNSKFIKWFKCRGTLQENEIYCSKQGSLIEFGQKPMGNGQKRCLENLAHVLVDAAQIGTPICDVVTEEQNRATFVQYHNGLTKLYQHAVTSKLRKVEKNFAPEVVYVWGPPGSGKTRYVQEKEPDVYRVPAADKYKWHDGYCGQDAVLYDNVTPKNVCPEQFLVEIDRYFIQVSTKSITMY